MAGGGGTTDPLQVHGGHGGHGAGDGVPAGAAHDAWHVRTHDSLTATAVHAGAAVLIAVLLHRADAVRAGVVSGPSGLLGLVRAAIDRVRALWAAVGERASTVLPRQPSPGVRRVVRPPPQRVVLANVVVRRGP
ncbi:hypothetical protein D7319_10145 [Streptomyces radicis]|uniref:Uncharacterized protein n=2 Tax=Streptomyces radicis TaxID=1750517 RepID=A0A3A9WAH1_9ACTN|nr:hypothetical protein D7319_10145 [Streptomyces radicis]RKN24460.1 hypothetical protein D7318_11325 [Streptomyces radicis]